MNLKKGQSQGVAPTNKKPFKTVLPSILLLSYLFLLFFISRLMLSPLLITLQEELSFSYTQAGKLFLFIATGGSIGLFFNPFITKIITHHKNISLACFLTGLTNINIAFSGSYNHLTIGLFFMGLTSGFYFPSGLATITTITKSKDWGKALSIHDLAPNIAYITTPIVAEIILKFASWRFIFILIAILQILLSIFYFFYMKGGKFCGSKPDLLLMKKIVSKKLFYILIFLFCIAVSAAVGLYTILPLFLASEYNFSRTEANQILSISRISGLFITLCFGIITDKLGSNFTFKVYFIITGIATILLGVCPRNFLLIIVIIQASAAVCFFPTGFAFISKIYGKELRSVAISLITPISTLIGLGITPTIFGFFGDRHLFKEAFIILGIAILSSFFLLPLEKWTNNK